MRWLLVAILFALSGFGCHAIQSTQQKPIYIPTAYMGRFVDDYGSVYTITNKEWKQDSKIKYHLLQYAQQGNYFIARNDSSNPSDGGLYTRIDIMNFDNTEPWYWGYCLTIYKASSIQEAINAAAADRNNPRKGCNGFPFSRMKRE